MNSARLSSAVTISAAQNQQRAARQAHSCQDMPQVARFSSAVPISAAHISRAQQYQQLVRQEVLHELSKVEQRSDDLCRQER
jgi:hypothetical protein